MNEDTNEIIEEQENVETLDTENQHKNEKKNEKHQKKLIDEIEKLKKELEESKKSETAAKENLLRHAAEFDNTKKRLQKSKEDAIKDANKYILLDLINILDDFDRALEHVENKSDNFYIGVKMIRDQLYSKLEGNYGLKYFTVVGEEFNPEFHEAISMIDSEEHKDKQVVLQEFQKGYLFGENVLRTAKVVVSKIN